MAKTKTKTKKAVRAESTVGNKARYIGDECCDEALPSSISLSEVQGIVEREVAHVKSKLTIFDDRVAVLRQLQENEADLEHLQERLHETLIQNKQIRSDLSRVNLAIRRQMELDGE